MAQLSLGVGIWDSDRSPESMSSKSNLKIRLHDEISSMRGLHKGPAQLLGFKPGRSCRKSRRPDLDSAD
jgi:hypothetical protein